MHIWQDCPHLTTHCLQDIAHGQCKGGQGHYWALHSSVGTWLVARKQYSKTKSWVSRFAHVRRVSIDPTTHVCTCSCLFHERHGIPCRHLYLFLGEVRSTDFDVRWWISYAIYYGEKGRMFMSMSLSVFVVTVCIGPLPRQNTSSASPSTRS